MLRCPRCGGPASAASTRCEFCAAPLLMRGCPRCLARVFHGHKHCPHCGCETDAADAVRQAERRCPRCQVALSVRAIDDIEVNECQGCAGVFIDARAIEKMLGDRQQARAEAVVGAYRATPRRMETPGGPNQKLYIKCPECGTIMNRKLFAKGTGVIVDVCRGHGTWFDAGELPVVVEFVMNGGLERAEKAEIERMRDEARRAKNEALSAQRSALTAPVTHDRGTALLDFLLSIWH